MGRIAGALKEFYLIRYPVDFNRDRDPLASWEKPPPPEPALPTFRPGTADGSFEHPVVNPDAADVATAIPSLRSSIPRPHRYDPERTIILVSHLHPAPRPRDDD